jgi:hypothetical protein
MKTTLNKFEKAAIRRNLKTLMPALKQKAKLEEKLENIQRELSIVEQTLTAIDTQTHVICGYTMEELTEPKTIQLADGGTKTIIDFKYDEILPPAELSAPEVIESTSEVVDSITEQINEEIEENNNINELNTLPEPPAEVEIDTPTTNQAPVDGQEIEDVFASTSTPKEVITDDFSF